MATKLYGRWKFNANLTERLYDIRIPLDFTCNGIRCYYISFISTDVFFVNVPYSEDNSIIDDALYGIALYVNRDLNGVDDIELFREIDLGTGEQTVSEEVLKWFAANATFVGDSTWKPVYQASFADNEWKLREAYQYLNNQWVKISSLNRIYSVSFNLSGIQNGNSITNTKIAEEGKGMYILTAVDGGNLPEKITVTNAEIVEWNRSTGKLVIDHPTGNVTITATV